MKTLPLDTPEEVTAEVRERIRVLSKNGSSILASSEHIQPDTPLANILAMYDLKLRYKTNSSKSEATTTSP